LDPFEAWLADLERRHLATLTFPEVRRGLQALSSLYVERRDRLGSGAALEGAGKRAAFAWFYGPLHFLLVREVLRALGPDAPRPRRILDLGCGTAAAGAAWALECGATLDGVERNPWAAGEARHTLRALGLSGRIETGDLTRAVPARGDGVLLAYAANELPDEARDRLLRRLLASGPRVLVVEPISRRATPWWDAWERAFAERGGRADTWRFPARLPERLRLLDKAAGLDHRELLGRTLLL
jgi:hypothetical protein